MKVASRFMPKYKAEPMRIWNWLIILALLTCVLLLFWKWSIYLLITLLALLFSVIASIPKNVEDKAHLKALAETRINESICTFSRYFDCREVDTWVIRAVYEQLQEDIYKSKDFPIRPTDNIVGDLRIDGEDLECGTAEEIAQRTGRSLKDTKSNPYYNKVNTVEDLVYFFNLQPKVNAD